MYKNRQKLVNPSKNENVNGAAKKSQHLEDRRPESKFQQQIVDGLTVFNANLSFPLQFQKWKFISNSRRKEFIPYGNWHSEEIVKPKSVKMEDDFGPDNKYREGDITPDEELNNGDIFDDLTGDIATTEEQKVEQRLKRKKRTERKDIESQRLLERETGEGFKSARLKKKVTEKYRKKRENLSSDEDTGIHHIRGDSPGLDYDFEDEGLHSALNRRIDILHTQQVVAINGDNEPQIEWLKIPLEIRTQIEQYKSLAEKNTDIIHHSEGERPKFTSSILGFGQIVRPGIKEDVKHTGIGKSTDNLSHSSPYAQVPDHLRHNEEGGVNHPKNIPYENKVTNQVVNVAIEKVAEKYLVEEKKIVKVTMRIWGMDRVDRSIHVYFVEDLPHPLVFGTKDLEDKIPFRWQD